jgi:acetate kinase
VASSPSLVLTLNVGSSSLKFCVFEMEHFEKLVTRGNVAGIGLSEATLTMENGEGHSLAQQKLALADHAAALSHVFEELKKTKGFATISAVGHRVVQGGPHHHSAQLVTAELIEELRALCPQDPPHLPAAIAGIEAAQRLGNNIKQVACFDTAFHRTMPAVAQRVALPAELTDELGIIRYGFHGLSYEYVSGELAGIAGPASARARVVIAHLGNGASMAALKEGRSVETTMGFTPAGGLEMGSRTGDLDPGTLIYLLSQKKVTIDRLNDLVYQKSGMKGISGLSSDMQLLQEASAQNPKARDAVEFFCYQARKALGALVAVLDGLDTLVFTGGIGEHSPQTRAQICVGLSHLGLDLDSVANDTNAALISTPQSRITVRVIPTNEELVIARQTAALCFPKDTQPEPSPDGTTFPP